MSLDLFLGLGLTLFLDLIRSDTVQMFKNASYCSSEASSV